MSRTADSILTLRSQVNHYAPHRNKDSDGTIGDDAHKQLGNKSDHNPWYNGIVTAVDITHDPSGGFDCDKLWDALIESGDTRIKYIIFKRRIINLTQGHPHFADIRKYSGLNAHSEHLHLSVQPKKSDETQNWQLWIFRLLTQGTWNREVGAVQKRLNIYGANIRVDDKFGPLTTAAVRAFQRSRANLAVDGIVGPKTRRSLGM